MRAKRLQTSMSLSVLVTALPVFHCLGATVPAADFFALGANDIDGNELSFEKLRGSAAVLITNVASE